MNKTNKELLESVGITADEEEVFRNYNYSKEERRKYIINLTKNNNYNCVSINKEYLIISNSDRDCIKVKLTDNQLIRLNKEISNIIWERNNGV